MSTENSVTKVGDETEISVYEGHLTEEEVAWLKKTGIFNITGRKEKNATRAELDVKKLSQLAFEHDILKHVASSVEVEIIEHYRNSGQGTLTTSELTDAIERPKSSVSRALSRLSEKGKLTKVQAGVYRYSS